MGYALSMFSETLRDRKLVTLQTDLIILIIGFLAPMMAVAYDCITLGDQATLNIFDYWLMFGSPSP